MIKDLAEGLLTAYWEAESYSGGRGKGQVMRNHCGITFCKYDYEGGHEARSKAMAWYLQGLEAACVHALTVLSEEYDYEVMANEHDGLITIGTIPEEAQERARKASGSRRAELTDKRFEDEEDVQKLCQAYGFDYPCPPTEDARCEEQTVGVDRERFGADAPPKRPGSRDGSGSTTCPAASNRPAESETSSTSVPPIDDGSSGSAPETETRPTSSATEQDNHPKPDSYEYIIQVLAKADEMEGGGGWAYH